VDHPIIVGYLPFYWHIRASVFFSLKVALGRFDPFTWRVSAGRDRRVSPVAAILAKVASPRRSLVAGTGLHASKGPLHQGDIRAISRFR
jgi:hypothetical protein